MHNGKSIRVHRLSFEIINGQITKGLLVCHKCDNRKCVNPSHLFLGTHKDNMQDCIKKNRIANGNKQHLSKLSPENIINIRKEYIPFLNSAQKIAKKYNVSKRTILCIIRNKTWKHIQDNKCLV